MFYNVVANHANPNIHKLFYSVGANRGQLLIYILRGEKGE